MKAGHTENFVTGIGQWKGDPVEMPLEEMEEREWLKNNLGCN